MATIYRCDVCGSETGERVELGRMKYTKGDGVTATLLFDICDKCQKKMLKPVKECRWKAVVKLTLDDKIKG